MHSSSRSSGCACGNPATRPITSAARIRRGRRQTVVDSSRPSRSTSPSRRRQSSCGSCHQPHGEWLSPSRCYPKQEPKVYLLETVNGEVRGTPYYTTYFLRVPGDPLEGFVPLCNSCHPR